MIAGSITDADYPAAAIRAAASGTTRVRLQVTPQGTVSACEVTAPSGHVILDTTACQLIAERFRFSPATSGGSPVAGYYSTAVRWSLPKGMPPPPISFASGSMRLTMKPVSVGKRCSVEVNGQAFEALAERLCPPLERTPDGPISLGADAMTFVLMLTPEGAQVPAPVQSSGRLIGEIEVDVVYDSAGKLVGCSEVLARRVGPASVSPCTPSDGNFFAAVTPDPGRPLRKARARVELHTILLPPQR